MPRHAFCETVRHGYWSLSFNFYSNLDFQGLLHSLTEILKIKRVYS